ncbi:putative indole-3-pyruvate monooxygenase YUCCA10 [Morella rubra]|uniref:Flavin-containing monooxygenase n=1 Tax=Morella rubra TaxID=262757 RepID=A0A6A1WPL8_9ROSI|nr:putative indole-3-pyruvate monooxygenase YUCCA10 [Morella rubra]
MAVETVVVIVGAGPSGLATAACLTRHSIPHVILEREDCYASLWKKRTYDQLGLHLAKEFCSLPLKSVPPSAPTFMPKDYFLRRYCPFQPVQIGFKYKSKDVLVVGCGNSGMEIAYDLSDHGASTSIVIRSPLHVLNKELVHRGMSLLKYLPAYMVDTLITMLAKMEFGDLSKYGIRRPFRGPFANKNATERSPIIDVGTIKKIRNGEIQVVSEISTIYKNNILFKNGTQKNFDAIVFATGYRATNKWLKEAKSTLNGVGIQENGFPQHWKGEKGLYCAGFTRRGLFGVSMDAKAIAEDINQAITKQKKKSSVF